MKNEKIVYGIGQMLKDKNALLNYIYEDGAKIGVVVGLKGKDRNTPLVGWTLFEEVYQDFGTFMSEKPLQESKIYKEDLKKIAEVIKNTVTVSNEEYKEVVDAVNRIANAPIHVMESTPLTEEERFRAVELALLRANSNRDNFFVCKNASYGQSNSVLKPAEKRRDTDPVIELEINGEYYNYNQDYDVIVSVRKAARAMEYRCWKYYKD